MKKITKKMTAGLIALAVAVTTMFSVNVTTTQAVDFFKNIYSSPSVVTLTKEKAYEFTVDNPSYGNLKFSTNMQMSQKTGFSVVVLNSEGRQLYDTVTISTDDSAWETSSENNAVGIAFAFRTGDPYNNTYYAYPKGKLTFRVTFDNDAQAKFYVYNYATPAYQAPQFSQETYTVGLGFKHTLTVNNDKVRTWKSSKKKIATVNSKGVVNGKKKGTTTITVTTDSGSILTCKVKVTANTYSAKKAKKSDVTSGMTKLVTYSAKYNKKGALVIKYMGINNTKKKATLHFAGVTALGSSTTLASSSKVEKTFKLPKNSAKSYKLTIPKSKLSNKADLTNGVEINFY